ncbi:unnamed protein product, partial [Mesorhabditis belari]|uniref:Peroxidase n=1 Tax=Mesorhabditis belari TaxID=2138241 RepID=A0AAF3FEN6_9BILA
MIRPIVALVAFAALAYCTQDCSDLQGAVTKCITDAFQQITIEQQNQLTTDDVVTSQKADPDAQAKQGKGDTLQRATELLVAQCGVEVINEIDTAGIDTDAIFDQVTANAVNPARVKRYVSGPMGDASQCREDQPCSGSEPIRRITGDCNNLQRAKDGASLIPFAKLQPPVYDDGIGSIRVLTTNKASKLPSARIISNKLFQQTDPYPVDTSGYSHLLMQFGQVIAHDLVLTPSSTGTGGAALDCSICDPTMYDKNCAPVTVPTGDPYFKTSCFKFTRALNAQTKVGPRIQINQQTHFLDLSVVYGANLCDHNKLRSFAKGQLKTQSPQGYNMMPTDSADTNCHSGPAYPCTLSGDLRTSLHPGLYAPQMFLLAEHNRIAQAITTARPQWPDERVFQETRRIVIAFYQHFVYTHYLPKILGSTLMTKFGLNPLSTGFFTGYNPSVDPAIMSEFGTNAFRFGHSEARSDFARVDNNNKTVGTPVMLGDNIFYQDPIYNKTAQQYESLGHGLMYTQMMKQDNQFSFDIRNRVFEIRGKPGSGIDLAATNIQRARDFGVGPYNRYRTLAGLKKAVTMDDFADSIPAAKIAMLKTVYTSPDDVDLYPGMVMENPVAGAVVGPTAGHIIGTQFKNLKVGDRFFYENQVPNSRGLNAQEIAAVRAFDFRYIYCAHSPSTTQIPKDIFVYNSPQGPCSNLKPIDLTPFLPPN